jgi:riboflavin kinase/FMN adenylyltransferase
VGVFDGVHRGHQALLGRVVELARQGGAEPVVVTFDPHPDLVLHGTEPPLLSDPLETQARLAAVGISHLVVQHFDAGFAALSATAFVGLLAGGRELVALVMTPESAFGRGREGTVAMVRELGTRMGFTVEEVEPLRLGGAAISSSRIRAALGAGRLAEATRLLGRRPAVTGTVVRGDGRGRQLGFPTANLAFDAPVALPPDGIYAVRVTWAGSDPLHPRQEAAGVVSLGVRPTFGGGARVLEVYLLDTDNDLYGKHLRVEFVRRQRGERRFAGVAGLIAQMGRDVALARHILRRSHAMYECPVCQFVGLTSKPYELWPPPGGLDLKPPYAAMLGQASYEVCPRCGFEFGNDDNPGTAAPVSFEEYRREWEARGRPWFGSR